MNQQHKINRIQNRLRRIKRRLTELEAAKAAEVRLAEKAKREPNLDAFYIQYNRLNDRYLQIA